MGKIYSELDERLSEFVTAQRMFFVATAPLATDGHINLSPKGLDSFRILGTREVAYLDLTGSGVETISHIRQNGRLTIMFCAFEGAPRILRLYGRGQTIEPGDDQWSRYRGEFPDYPGVRSVIAMDIERIADSCGFAVPRFAFQDRRTQLTEYAQRKGEETLVRYRREQNSQSIDGLPGLRQTT